MDLLTFSANWTATGSVQDLILRETRRRHTTLEDSQRDLTEQEKMAGCPTTMSDKKKQKTFDREQTQ